MIITKNINNSIILIDGSFYMHRAYHAYPPLNTSTGYPVGAIYGFINMIKNLLIKYQPTHMGIIFDGSKKTFRTDLYKQYKSNRVKTPQELYNQILPVHEIIKSMGISILNIPYVEADDVIATLAIFYERMGKTVLISTGDKDMAQIVSSKIILVNTKLNIILDPIEIKKKFGVPPCLIVDYLALTGDRSDNIPGVPGIGKITAQTLLNKIGNFFILYKNLEKILTLNMRRAQKIYNSLIINKNLAWISYQLATLKTNVPLKQTDYSLSIQEINIPNLLLLFKKYEFKNWLEELKSGTWLKQYQNIKQVSINLKYKNLYHNNTIQQTAWNSLKIIKKKEYVIYDNNTLKDWVKKNYPINFIIFYIHTDTANTITTKIISICLCAYTNYTMTNIYIPIKRYPKQSDNDNIQKNYLYISKILCTLKPILENPKIEKIGQNIKFNYTLLKNYSINLTGIIFDVMLELYVLYGTTNYQYIKRFLDSNTLDIIIKFNQTYTNYNNYIISSETHDIKLELSYAIQLMCSMFNLHQLLWSQIQKNNKLKQIFKEIEIPLIFALSRIEEYGVLIDKNLLNSYSIELSSRLNLLKMQAHQLTGISFNLSSNKQLQEVLYTKQKLPIFKKTPHGAPSTNEEVLKKLSKIYLIPKIILEYRSLFKLQSTYVNKLTSMINIKSNRIHTSYHQIRTSTGRLSSTNPNLQNIPNRNHDGKKIRQAFIAPENYLIISADYSQIELRIMAHLSHDLKLINDFISNKDIHIITASEIFVTELNLVTREQRQRAKTINFGLIYGMTAFGLAKQLSVTRQEAQKYVNRYFQRYSGIMQYMQYIKHQAYKYGYVSTLNGRKLYLPGIYSDNVFQKKSAERTAINAPMQGSAADIIKKAMISIDNWLQNNKIPARMIIQVHDELVFEVQIDYIDIVTKKIKQLMEKSYILDVPLKVDIGIGKNWEQAH